MRILVVSTQFPFPPRFGFARRVYHLTRHLARHHDVTLLSYAGRKDAAGVTGLREELRVEVVEREQRPLGAKRLAQLVSMASPRPFSCRAVHSKAMQRAITDLCAREDYDVVQLESSLLCGLAAASPAAVVLDEHNVEYEVFARMHKGERGRARRAFNRVEHARFRRFEQRWWRRVAACIVTSGREAEIVRSYAPGTPTAVVPNGVDLAYFSANGAESEPRTLVFNGILDYRPNLDAAHHLVQDIWPRVLRRCPDARLEIVGRGHAADLQRLRRTGVVVTGEVPDVRLHLDRAAVVGVPIRMGGGTRLKVVEGLAMGKPVVSTTIGCEGISVRDGVHLLVADDPETFASRVVEVFEDADAAGALGTAGRELAEREYSWDLAGERLDALYRQLLTRS